MKERKQIKIEKYELGKSFPAFEIWKCQIHFDFTSSSAFSENKFDKRETSKENWFVRLNFFALFQITG